MNEEAIELLQSTGYMLLGMQMDPSIPDHAKDACRERAAKIFAFIDECGE